MFYVYILKSLETGKYYIGSCNNIAERLSRHNKKQVKSTKAFAPWTVFHKETFNTLSEARDRENQIKLWKSRSAIENLVKHL